MQKNYSASMKRKKSLSGNFRRNKYLYLMLLPMVIWYLVFRYAPMYGLLMSLQDFKYNLGIKSPFVGFKNFIYLFSDETFLNALFNTFYLNCLKLLVRIPLPIIFAIMLNELSNKSYRKLVQTISSAPHFISWVALAGMITPLFALNTGLINILFSLIGIDQVNFLANQSVIRGVMVFTDIWKELGWLAVVYLAAISSINPVLHESAMIDGANRFQRILNITLPCIKSTIAINAILAVGNIMQMGFDQVYNLYNAAVFDKVDIIDTYIVRNLTSNPDFGVLAAADMIKAVICLVMLLIANRVVQKMGEEGIYSTGKGV